MTASWVLVGPALASISLSKSICIRITKYVTTLVLIPFKHKALTIATRDFSYTIPKSHRMTSLLQVEMGTVAVIHVPLRPPSPKFS